MKTTNEHLLALLLASLAAACGNHVAGGEPGDGHGGGGGVSTSPATGGGLEQGGEGGGTIVPDPSTTLIPTKAGFEKLATPADAPNCVVTGGNASHQMVGFCSNYLNNPAALSRAVVWSSLDAEPELLPFPPGSDVQWHGAALGINDDGVIIGDETLYDGLTELYTLAMRWTKKNGAYVAEPLSTPADGTVSSGAINAAGLIVGGIRNFGGPGGTEQFGGFTWKDGTFALMAPLSADEDDYPGSIVGLDGTGDVLLLLAQAFVDGHRSPIPIPATGIRTYVSRLGEAGVAVGGTLIFTDGDRAARWEKKSGNWVAELLPPVDPDVPYTSDGAEAIGATGDIAGWNTISFDGGKTKESRVVVWTPEGILDLGNAPEAWVASKAEIPLPVAVFADKTIVANLTTMDEPGVEQQPVVIRY